MSATPPPPPRRRRAHRWCSAVHRPGSPVPPPPGPALEGRCCSPPASHLFESGGCSHSILYVGPPPGVYQNGRTPQEGGAPPPPPQDCGVHYLWFAFVCFLIRSHPPPKTKVTFVGKNEIYNQENLIGPFLVHKLLGPRPPLAPSPPFEYFPAPPSFPRLGTVSTLTASVRHHCSPTASTATATDFQPHLTAAVAALETCFQPPRSPSAAPALPVQPLCAAASTVPAGD